MVKKQARLQKNDVTLKDNEYVVSADSVSSKDYEIYYKGELLNDVIYIVRVQL